MNALVAEQTQLWHRHRLSGLAAVLLVGVIDGHRGPRRGPQRELLVSTLVWPVQHLAGLRRVLESRQPLVAELIP